MTSALQVISQSLSLVGIKSAGQNLSEDDSADCLNFLNAMVDSWRNESLFAHTKQRITASVSGQTATIGPTGDFVISPRPFRIESGSFFSVGGIDYPIEPIGAAEYNAISLKGQGALGPAVVYLDAAMPNGTLYFYPLAAGDVTLLCLVQIGEFADLYTDYDLAPGQKRALVYSLAEEVASIFGAKVPAIVSKVASAARRNLKRANHTVPQLEIRQTGCAAGVVVTLGTADDGIADGGTP